MAERQVIAPEGRQSLAHGVSYGCEGEQKNQPRRGDRTLLSPLRGCSLRPQDTHSSRCGLKTCAAPRLALLCLALLLAGCGGPNAANIELRKQNQALEGKISALNQDLDAARARIGGLEQRIGTVPTLPQARLDALFTVHKIDIGRLSGGADLARDGGFDEGLKLYVTPVDAASDPLKATGRMTVRAFDLANPPILLGEWIFTPEQLKQQWVGFRIIYSFVIELPWQKVPPADRIVVKVTFEDALTGRVLSAVQEVKINPPPQKPTDATTRP